MLTERADNNNKIRLSRNKSFASRRQSGGRRNVLTTSPQEDEKRIDVATRATVLLLVRFLSLFLEAVSSAPTARSEYSALGLEGIELG